MAPGLEESAALEAVPACWDYANVENNLSFRETFPSHPAAISHGNDCFIGR
jgi:hypothetical protein